MSAKSISKNSYYLNIKKLSFKHVTCGFKKPHVLNILQLVL